MISARRNIAFVALIMTNFGSWAMSTQEIKQKWRPSTVFISVEAESNSGAKVNSSGSGFVVSSDGYVLTAGHIIPNIPAESNRNLKITGKPSSRYAMGEEMEFITRDPYFDFALLRFKNTSITPHPAHFGDPRQVLQSDSELYALGFPLHTEFSAKSGKLNGTGGPGGAWITSIPLNPGDSGGPVFNDQGQVVAMVASALKEAEGIKYVLPINFAVNLLNIIRVEIPSRPTTFTSTSIKDCATCPEMVVIPSGEFDMGSHNGESNEKPVHRVQVSAFALGKTEITQGQWRAVMGNNPSGFASCGDDCPVDNVSWDDAQLFIQKLNAKTGKQYRWPSEAEWEYACRAGGQHEYCGSNDLDSVAWHRDNSASSTHPTSLKQPNAYGLYDMSGNVFEWVEDTAYVDYLGAPTNGSARPPANGAQRVIRGGSWYNEPRSSRAAFRGWIVPTSRGSNYGFRVARMLP